MLYMSEIINSEPLGLGSLTNKPKTASPSTSLPSTSLPQPEKEESNNTLYIIIGFVLAILLIGLLLWLYQQNIIGIDLL